MYVLQPNWKWTVVIILSFAATALHAMDLVREIVTLVMCRRKEQSGGGFEEDVTKSDMLP